MKPGNESMCKLSQPELHLLWNRYHQKKKGKNNKATSFNRQDGKYLAIRRLIAVANTRIARRYKRNQAGRDRKSPRHNHTGTPAICLRSQHKEEPKSNEWKQIKKKSLKMILKRSWSEISRHKQLEIWQTAIKKAKNQIQKISLWPHSFDSSSIKNKVLYFEVLFRP